MAQQNLPEPPPPLDHAASRAALVAALAQLVAQQCTRPAVATPTKRRKGRKAA
jgi:hypothetical protein